jgi:hypothetical protein
MRRSPQIAFSQRIAKLFSWSALLFCASLLPNALTPHSASAQTYPSQPVTVGYRDFGYGTEVFQDPTAEKPQSKLWWNDGLWWGCLWDPVASAYRIHRFDLANQSWVNVGPDVDDRANTLSDVLWDGQKLYIASHVRIDAVGPARLYRYSYNAATKSYSLDAGFPVDIINNERAEALTLAKDSNGKLWATWEANTQIMVNRTIGDDWTWGVPFQLPVQGSAVKTDDISAIVAITGNRIGIMWSNQNDMKMYFAVHHDNKDDLDWEVRENAVEDPILSAMASDHLNPKTTSDNGGTVYAVTKTSLTNPNDPLILFLKRNSAGVWTRETVWTKSEDPTRPILLIDDENKNAYVFAMSTKNGPTSIYVKSTSLSNPQFPPGMGTVFIQSATDLDVNNPSSTKQNLNSTTGLLVMASDAVTRTYLHNYMPILGNQPPVAVNDAATTDEDVPVTIDVTANDTDTDGTVDATTVAIVAQAANGATAVNPTTGVVTYSPDPDYFGVDTFTYTVNDDQGATSNVATVTVTVNEVNDPPAAVNDAAATSVNTPVNISVTDNDTDADGTLDVTTVAIATGPGNGAATINPTTGVVTYTPNAGYMGNDALTYTVKDDDGASSNAATVAINVTAGGPTTQTFLPVADAQVKSSSPTTNYGAQRTMRLRNGDPAYNSYLKFEVTQITGAVLSAKLRLYVTNASVDGGSIYWVSNDYLDTTTPWEEIGLTWSNAPAISGAALGSVGAAAGNSWVEVELTAAIAGNGSYSFGLQTNSSNRVIYSTKEGVYAPELVITSGDDTPVPPVVASFSPASGSVNTPVTIIGSNFLGVIGVAFNGTAAAFVISSDTQIDATVPNGATTGNISVSNVAGTTYSAQSFTVTPLPNSVTLTPSDDAQVKSSNPTTNYGSDNTFRLRAGDPTYNSYLKFQVSPLSGPVQSAVLRLYVTDDSPHGGSVYLVSNNFLGTSTPWDEDNLTWGNAPAINGTPLLGAIGYANANTWVEFDVTATITGNGIYSFGLTSGSTNSALYSSKEGANPPQLVVVTGTTLNFARLTKIERTGTTALLPEEFSLSANYPNPFNIQTIIRYALPVEGKVQLAIYNLVGQKVRTLVDEIQPAGYQQVHWDGHDQYGHEIGSGIYLIRLEAGQQRFVRRITLLK